MPLNPTISQTWSGNRVSLARQTSQILTELEEQFGPMDRSFLFIGWEFDGEHPMIFHADSGNKHVLMRLSLKASEYWNTAVHELAHECVHLLHPVVGTANNFEEGLATWYADYFYRKVVGLDPGGISEAYAGAHDAFLEFLEHAEDGSFVIRELRKKSLAFSDITAFDLLRFVPTLSPITADFLVRKWDSSRPNKAT
ncbi:MAG: hypothetical protein QE267_04365 [Akkermansiaceae bacterium]|nr:hypothetical protein [Akkermansiaceae bacterium]